MRVDKVNFNCELSDVLTELQSELAVNGIKMLSKIKETSTHFQVQCPFHSEGQERRPSAGIRKEDGLLHCFTCNEVHSLPETISQCFGKNDFGVFGWQWLLKNFAIMQVGERRDVDLDFARDSSISSNNKFSIRRRYTNTVDYISDKELDKYRYTHPYLYERGMTDDIIEIFDLGYDSSVKAITFPIKDIHGNCLYIARRSINLKWYNYPEGVEKPLYGLYELLNHRAYKFEAIGKELTYYPDEVIICEGMFDALSCWVYGRCALALNGLGSELQFKQLRELPFRKLILATDNDKRGLDARDRIKKNVPNKLITEYVLPDSVKDINEMLTKKLDFSTLKEVF